MKIVHLIIVKLVCLLALVVGVLVVIMWFDQAKCDLISQYVATQIWPRWEAVVGGIVLLLSGMLGFLPLYRPKISRNIISYPGAHGSVTIQLDSVESTLSRVLSKLPEVRKISVRVTATEDNHSARVSADVLVYKGAGSASAREITNRIGSYLHDAAVNILGAEEVTSVNLNIRGIVVDAAQANILRETADRDSAVREREALLRDEPAVRDEAFTRGRDDILGRGRDESPNRGREEAHRDEPRTRASYASEPAYETAAYEGAPYGAEADFEQEADASDEFDHDAHEVVVSTEARVVGASDTSFGSLLDEDAGASQEKKTLQDDSERSA